MVHLFSSVVRSRVWWASSENKLPSFSVYDEFLYHDREKIWFLNYIHFFYSECNWIYKLALYDLILVKNCRGILHQLQMNWLFD